MQQIFSQIEENHSMDGFEFTFFSGRKNQQDNKQLKYYLFLCGQTKNC
jgi:hypothetical protein